MALDHDAIRKAYPNAAVIDDGTGVFDSSGNKITIEQSKVDAARVELAKLDYQWKRRNEYPFIGDQLDNLYKDILAGKVDATGEFAKAIKTIKDKYPKS
tara:strand:- start:643 stop:939 length:297 start_codon:yes stop_codon:yes gene_type:complete